jgi:hypothetical protein
MTPARIAIWALSISAAVLIILIVGHSGSDAFEGKVFATAALFVLFSLFSLGGLLLIERQPHLAFFGAMAVGFSIAAYFVVLDTFFSSGVSGSQHSVETLAIITLAVNQASMLFAFRRDDDTPLVNAVAFGSLITLTLLAVLAIVDISNPGQDISPKLYAVLAVLYLLTALLPPCLRWAETEEI